MSMIATRPTVLYSTLISESFGQRCEDRCIMQLITGWELKCRDKYELQILVGSAHDSALATVDTLLKPWSQRVELVRCPFVHDPQHDEQRAHEIAFCKQHLAREWEKRQFDYLLHLDSDLAIEFDEIDRLIKSIDDPMTFINIPYAIHTQNKAPVEQLGAFIHTRQLMTKLPYTQAIYQPFVQSGKTHRHDAPDCAIRNHLLMSGAKEQRALAVTTRHYRNQHTYARCQAGQISTHADTTALLGFDPHLDGMAMDLESCLAIQNFCRSRNVKRVLNLGTGSGNSMLAAAKAGVTSIISIDEHESYTRYGHQLAAQHSLERIVDCQTLPLDPTRHRAYDLRSLALETFDLVIVDVPQTTRKAEFSRSTR